MVLATVISIMLRILLLMLYVYPQNETEYCHSILNNIHISL